MFSLSNCQRDTVNKIIKWLSNHKTCTLYGPCGSGKTFILSRMDNSVHCPPYILYNDDLLTMFIHTHGSSVFYGNIDALSRKKRKRLMSYIDKGSVKFVFTTTCRYRKSDVVMNTDDNTSIVKLLIKDYDGGVIDKIDNITKGDIRRFVGLMDVWTMYESDFKSFCKCLLVYGRS